MGQTMKRILGMVLATMVIGGVVTAPAADASAPPGTTSIAASTTNSAGHGKGWGWE